MFLLASQTAATRSLLGGYQGLPPQFELVAGRVLALRRIAGYNGSGAHDLRFHSFVYDVEVGLLMVLSLTPMCCPRWRTLSAGKPTRPITREQGSVYYRYKA